MPWNLLILPLVSGYFFLTRSHLYRYQYRLLDRQRLLLESVIVASVLLILAYIVTLTARQVIPVNWIEIYEDIRPFPYTGTASLTFLLSLVATYPLNWITNKEDYQKKAIRKHGSALDRIILDAIENPQQLCFSLDNGKVYIGYPLYVSDLVNSGMVTLFPFFSGYRNENQEITITTFYEDFYNNLLDEYPNNDSLEF